MTVVGTWPGARWDGWPVVVVGRAATPGVADSNQRVNEEFFVALAEALERGGRFGLVVDKSNVDLYADTRRTEAEREGNRWLKTARDRIAERCAGIAYVVSEHVLDDERVRRGIAAGPQVYGCPTEAFADRDGARRWLTAALTGPAREAREVDDGRAVGDAGLEPTTSTV